MPEITVKRPRSRRRNFETMRLRVGSREFISIVEHIRRDEVYHEWLWGRSVPARSVHPVVEIPAFTGNTKG